MHPIAFNIGPLSIHLYGVMVALGFLAGLWTGSKRAPREGIAPDKVLDLGPWLVVGAMLGARMLYVITYWREQFADKPISEIFMIHHGGLVYYGGFLGAASAGILFVRLKKIPMWKLADVIAPSVALGYAFGRLGCLFNGCCYGRACDLPWAIRFPPGHETHPAGSPATPVHPTQIYESLLSLSLYAGLAWLYRRKKFDGQVFAAYLICYPFLRSFVEFFRGDYPAYQHYLGWATPAQLLSIFILAVGLLLFFMLPRPQLRPANRGLKTGD